MIPSSLTLVVGFVTFAMSAFNYFLQMPERLVLSVKFLLMGGSATLMVIVVGLDVAAAYDTLLSWILFLAIVAWCVGTVLNLRATLAMVRAKSREEAAQMARRL